MDTKNLFSETQRFKQGWLWTLLLLIFVGINSFFFYGIYIQVIKGELFGDKPMSDTGLLITTAINFIVTLSLVCLFIFLKLDTQIREEGIYVKFSPFHRTYKKYKWKKISKSFVRQYSPIKEYGGWGLRFGFNGKAFNVSGNKGLQLVFTDGKKLLIGTNKPEKLNEVLNKLGKAN